MIVMVIMAIVMVPLLVGTVPVVPLVRRHADILNQRRRSCGIAIQWVPM
jgi:hypothetical protein